MRITSTRETYPVDSPRGEGDQMCNCQAHGLDRAGAIGHWMHSCRMSLATYEDRRHTELPTSIMQVYRCWIIVEHQAQLIHETLDDMLAVHERIQRSTSSEPSESKISTMNTTCAPQILHFDRAFNDEVLLDGVVKILDHLTQMCEVLGYTLDDVLALPRQEARQVESGGWT